MRPVRTIAVSGHRWQHLPREAGRYIRAAIRELADQYPGATWLTGGAVGTDQIATAALLERHERVELVLPFPPHIQGARWSSRDQAVHLEHLSRVASISIVSPFYDAGAYRERNRQMVARADLLLACWNGRPGTGTAMTVRMAAAKQIPVIEVPMY